MIIVSKMMKVIIIKALEFAVNVQKVLPHFLCKN